MTRIIAYGLLGLSILATTAPAPAQADPRGCPPGLARQGTGCLPPGQAMKHGLYHRGDRIDGDYIVLRHPGRYGLDPDETYYRVGDHVYRVNRETREVLDLIGAAAAVLD